MPLQPELVEIVFEGLDQKTDNKSTLPGRMRTAENVEFDKLGILNKRRGYTRIDPDDEVTSQTVEQILLNVATRRDELVIFGSENLYSVVSVDGTAATDASVVQRGPSMAGGFSIHHVVSASLGEEV